MTELKKKQEENKQRKFEKENTLPPVPFKMREFQNVEAKVSTVNQVKLHPKSSTADEKLKKSKSISVIKTKPKQQVSSYENPLYKLGNNNNCHDDENIVNIIGSSSNEDGYQIMGKDDYVIEHKVQDSYNELKKKNRSLSKPHLTNVYDKKQTMKEKIKGPTPKADDINTLLPRKNVNHIQENKNKIIQEQVPIRAKQDKPTDNFEKLNYDNYGKIPDYISKYKQEVEEKKEAERRQAEEAKYPKGTRLISEEERLGTLDSLNKTKKEIESALFKLPITMRTLSMQSKKAELEAKLDELDAAINQFSRKKVFVKSDS